MLFISCCSTMVFTFSKNISGSSIFSGSLFTSITFSTILFNVSAAIEAHLTWSIPSI